MAAVLIGIMVGAAQMFLLRAVATPLVQGSKPKHTVLLILLKLALYATVLLGTALIRPDRLIHMGAGLAGGLCLAAVVQFICYLRAERVSKGGKNLS